MRLPVLLLRSDRRHGFGGFDHRHHGHHRDHCNRGHGTKVLSGPGDAP
jgi:hypothetical protein